MRNVLFKFTPLGKADFQVREFLGEKADEKQLKKYEKSLDQYRHVKFFQIILKVLLYAGIVTSVAATFGLEELRIIQQIASYIGVSVLFVLYGITSYITMVRRESYHVQREILVSESI